MINCPECAKQEIDISDSQPFITITRYYCKKCHCYFFKKRRDIPNSLPPDYFLITAHGCLYTDKDDFFYMEDNQ
ncbi:MAG: hypothetical protein ACW980_24020 [Promethearchaeota archaeon]